MQTESDRRIVTGKRQSRAIVVLCTCPSMGVAEQVAGQIVDKQLAACVNIIPGVKSVYRWEGKIAQDDEIMLMIKATSACFETLCEAIREIHPYELPEVIGVSIEHGHEAYLNWIEESVR